jgi:ankyrin repeat protein
MKFMRPLSCLIILTAISRGFAADLTAEEKLKQKLDARIIKGLESCSDDIQQGTNRFQNRFANFMTIINEGGDPNISLENNLSLLTLGIISGNAGFVKFLTIKHADINTQTVEGISPLALALALLYAKMSGLMPEGFDGGSLENYYKIARLLAEKGAILDTNNLVDASMANAIESQLKTSNDKTQLKATLQQLFAEKLAQAFLFYLIRLNTTTGVTKLLDRAPGLVNAKNKVGMTPLHLAISCKAVAIIDLLLHKGADASVENNDGLTAYDFAEIINNQNITALFQTATLPKHLEL